MKRMFLTCVLAICCVLTGYGQFWISFHWDSPGCDQCVRMESALRLSPKRAEKYHKIIHKYGKKIEKEARREYRYWDRAAERIYDLRMSRDREIQRLLSPSQFDLYIRLTRENPKRIHDYRPLLGIPLGWTPGPSSQAKRSRATASGTEQAHAAATTSPSRPSGKAQASGKALQGEKA